MGTKFDQLSCTIPIFILLRWCIAEYLLEAGASVGAVDISKNSALHLACENVSSDFSSTLLFHVIPLKLYLYM